MTLSFMKHLMIMLLSVLLAGCSSITKEVPAHLKKVDQVLWITDDLDNVIEHWQDLGFSQIKKLDTLEARLARSNETIRLRLALANLGGAHIAWIQPLDDHSVFAGFLKSYGNGAMSLVHRLGNNGQLQKELDRLSSPRH